MNNHMGLSERKQGKNDTHWVGAIIDDWLETKLEVWCHNESCEEEYFQEVSIQDLPGSAKRCPYCNVTLYCSLDINMHGSHLIWPIGE